MSKASSMPQLVIVSPALRDANNGNWQTARRWATFLRARYRVSCSDAWDGDAAEAVDPAAAPALLIALHARRSAPAIAAFAARFPQRPRVVVLTGTDLYRDIRSDAAAKRSLELATTLVVLQPAGCEELPDHLRAKARVIYQSAPSLVVPAPAAARRHFTVIMVGHLREEKDPATYMAAAGLVRTPAVRLQHVGAALDPALGEQARQTEARLSPQRYAWLGARSHAVTRQRVKRSDLMVIASRMEGGANVIIEAVTSGVPVLASDIPGNRGMLGEDYAGYFPTGDSAALARLIDGAATDPVLYATLQRQCARRALLFAPALEKAAVLELADNCLFNSIDSSA